MTEHPPEDERILAIRRDAQRRLEAEDRARREGPSPEAIAAEARRRVEELSALAKLARSSEPAADPTDDQVSRIAYEFEAQDAEAEAHYQRRSYFFLGLSILVLTFFVGYGADRLVSESLTVAVLLLMSGLAGVWSILLAREKYRRGMLVAEHIRQTRDVEEQAHKDVTFEAARAAVRRAASSSRTSSSRAKVIREHAGTRTGRTYRGQ